MVYTNTDTDCNTTHLSAHAGADQIAIHVSPYSRTIFVTGIDRTVRLAVVFTI